MINGYMDTLPFAETSDLVRSLKQIESSTEELFLEFAHTLPELVKEMKQSLASSDDAIHAMERGVQGGGVDDGAVHRWTDQFQSMAERDSHLFDQLRAAVGNLQEISASIEHIRLDSEDMEIVSLNAMTVALKAGNAGRAFSYITEELKKLSNRTVALSDDVSRRGNALIESFSHFEAELEQTRTVQGELLDTFRERITRTFEDFSRVVQTTIRETRDLRDRSGTLQTPINGMMETIQLQDLIRQSIDHIILALEEVKPEEALSSTEEVLDELAFLRDIPRLATALINDVAEQIDASTASFLSLTDNAEKCLQDLERERRLFLSGTRSAESSSDNVTFEALMREMTAILEELLRDLNRNLKRKENLVKRSDEIAGSVEELQDTFRVFQTLVSRFHSIDIAARIEVAKQSTLRSMENSTEQMTRLTRKIGDDVESSLAVTRSFIDSTAVVMNSFREAHREEVLFAGRFQQDMQSYVDMLHTDRDHITGIVGNFSLFTDRFFQVFTRSKENGKKLQETADEIRKLIKKIDSMKQDIEKRYQQTLRENDVSDWTIEDNRLREIIERFTIFTQKQQAGELVGFEIEQGTAAGDVTLF